MIVADTPREVACNRAFLIDAGVWFVESRNAAAISCADAARKRRRLSHRKRHQGIPLSDELKSAVWRTSGSRGKVVVLHCRGHQLLDEEKVRADVGADARRMEPEELEAEFGLVKGLVNPFTMARQGGVRQVFDRTVVQPYFPPYTMMTNLGDLQRGVEFSPPEMIEALPHTSIGDLVLDSLQRAPIEHTLGILTGNGPESGRLLWKRIDDCIRDRWQEVPFRGDIGYPRVVIESLPSMGESMDLPARVNTVRPVVLDGVRNLCERGATVIGIACNTSQYFAPEVREVCRAYNAQFISMVDATAARLRELNISSAKFLGIGSVSDFERWSDFSRLNEQFALALPESSIARDIDDLAFLVKENGATSETVNPMRDLIRRTAPDEDDVVVLALTELSVLIATQKGSSRQIIDTLQILAERMADTYLAERIPLEQNPAS